MIPPTTERVLLSTPARVNDSISEKARANVARYAGAAPPLLDQRLSELDHEWDVERTNTTLGGLAVSAGVALAALLGEVWLLLPLAVGVCMVLHGLIGWSPGTLLLRSLGVRTAQEIGQERYALKALRGDFQRLDVVTTPQDRADHARFEGEGGAVVPDAGPDVSDPGVVDEALRAAR